MKTQKTKTTNDTTIEITTITTSCSSYSDDSNTGIIQRKKYYGEYLEIAQKDIEGANVTCRNKHVILR